MRRAVRGWGWLAPALVVLLAVTGRPLGQAIWQSMSSSTLTNSDDRQFVGFDLYANVLSSREWWLSVAVTLAVVIVVVLLQLALALVFATALNRFTAVVPVTRVVVLVPFAVLAIVNAFFWRDALFGGFIADWFRLDEMGRGGELAAWTVAEVWRGTAFVTLIVWVGLSRVSQPLLDAATADGATASQRLRLIVLPAIGPFVAAAAAFRVLDTLRSMESILLGETNASSLRPVTALIWDTTFSSFEVGLGAATSIVLLVLAGLLGLLLIPLFRVRRVV